MHTIYISGKPVWKGGEIDAKREYDAAVAAAKEDFRRGHKEYTITLSNDLGVIQKFRPDASNAIR